MSKCLVFINAFTILYLCRAEVINVALNKPAKMSSRFGRETLPAGGAVDGEITTWWPNLVHTAEFQNLAWWSVDLQTQVQDALVKIYFRKDYEERRNGVRLYTSGIPFSTYPDGQLCHRFTGTNISDVVHVNCTGIWRYLMVYTDTRNDERGIALDFGEVEVLGCDGTYGLTCDNNCSLQCAVTPTSCDRYTGACNAGGCKAGWMGTHCTQECDGSYGQNCNKSCYFRHCAVTPSTCDRFTGACPTGGCKAGWMGIDCTQVCSDGTYGSRCTATCGNCTGDETCNHVTGSCPGGCEAGWRGNLCKQGCADGTYGVNCLGTCGRCKNACDLVDGRCFGGCQDGYSGDQCLFMITFGDPGAVVAYVIGALIGVVVTVVVIGGILVCLFRRGRVKYQTSSRCEDAERPVQMCDVTSPPITNIYDKPDLATEADYDVIQHNAYENS